LFNDPTKKTKLNLATDNSVSIATNSTLLNTTNVVNNDDFYRPIFNSIYYFNNEVDKVDTYSIIQIKNFYNLFKRYEITNELTNPKKPKFFFDKDFNNDAFLTGSCFNNHSILNNTSRLLWFDTTNNGDLLKCDLSTGTTINRYEELVSGIDYTINDRTYLHIIILLIIVFRIIVIFLKVRALLGVNSLRWLI
jgi:hypothetical protein